MALDPNFPADPYVILHPDIRWYPGNTLVGGIGRGMLVPPLVTEVRRYVFEWRQNGYPGVSATTRSLLAWWFERDHIIYTPEATLFRWYFAQREALESAIWLFEVAKAHDPLSLLRYDSSGAISQGMFDETWTRYLLKLATGAGKTKVASLLITWCYFHKLYEPESGLSTNVLLIAPNIIVLDRLKVDFEGARIFRSDPLVPANGFDGRDWTGDFQLTVHVQDEVPANLPARGNLFLTNIHRVGENDRATPEWDLSDFFLGPKPVGKTTDTKTDLGILLRTVDDLVVINDEAHHVRADTQWFAEIKELDAGFRRRNPPPGCARNST
jgi:type III restriction enzyme